MSLICVCRSAQACLSYNVELLWYNAIVYWQEWKDDRLAWKASDKDDIEIIYADPSTIWHPELIVDNS